MTPTAASQKELRDYTDTAAWKRLENRECETLGRKLARGMSLFRGLVNAEAKLQRRSAGDAKGSDYYEDFCGISLTLYSLWVRASESYLEEAERFEGEGHAVPGIAEFRETLEEARNLVELLEMEDEIPGMNVLEAIVSPENPDSSRYGD